MTQHNVRLLGAHMSIAGGVVTAIERGTSVGCTAIQIFTKNNNQWHAQPLTPPEQAAFVHARKQSAIQVVFAHDSYLINLAATRRALRERSVRAFRDELERAEQLELAFLVMHPGAHVGDGEAVGIKRVAEGIRRALSATPHVRTKVLLETTAGQGTNIGYKFEHLRDILDHVNTPQRMGVCFDTCHVFAAGYDFRRAAGYHEVMQEFDNVVGIDHICAFHLNDSKKALHSRVDRHEHIGKGFLGLEAFRCLMNDERFFNIPMVLETPKGKDLAEDRMNLETLRSLIQ